MNSPELALQRHRELRFGDVRYDFYISSGPSSWGELEHRFATLDADRFLLVVDAGLPPSTIAKVKVLLDKLAPTKVVPADPTEAAKKLSVVGQHDLHRYVSLC